tara:strand:- start:467 stop:778 length:312 start_codon:yes stop_codon:yes gene_type:complete
MLKIFKKYILSLSLIGFIFILIPSTSYAQNLDINRNLLFAAQQNTINNYEKSQPSSIDNPVVDPNFNVMRSSDTESSTAIYIVIGLLVVATIIPLATWWYFSK